MCRRPLLALALLPALMLAACGGGTSTGGGYEPPAGKQATAAFDARDAPLACITRNGIQGVKATQEGQANRIDILPATGGAWIVFASTAAESQNAQLHNQDPGAEMIGPAIFNVGTLPDGELQKIEKCLEAQGSNY